jgi:N-acetylglucosaminyldiphosphoundecaprenol N-acetyl-beta-D-mannosaminyltransferase
MKKIDLFNIRLSTGGYKEFIRDILFTAQGNNSAYACLVNVHMLIEAKRDIDFQHELDNARLLLPDGKPLGWALKLLYGIKQDRVAGMDLLPDLIAEAEMQNLPVFFYGGTQDLLDKTKQFLEKNYPRLPLAGFYSPPFRNMNEEEETAVVKMINDSGAHIVFVVLGCPKQENWMGHMKDHINAYMIGVGGALPVLIGNQKRAPKWMQRYGLEWFFRLSQEPGRLFKRYAVTNTLFIILLLKNYVQLKLFRKAF